MAPAAAAAALRLLLLLLPAVVIAHQAPNCRITLNPDGSVTYQLSEPPEVPPNCTVCWEDGTRTVVNRDSEFDTSRVVNVTDDSITMRSCEDKMKYRIDCLKQLPDFNEQDCEVNCSQLMKTPQPSHQGNVSSPTEVLPGEKGNLIAVAAGIGIGIGIVIVIVVVIGIGCYKSKCEKFKSHVINGFQMVSRDETSEIQTP